MAAALSVVVASVQKGTGATLDTTHVAGEAVTAGQVVYLKTSDSKWWLAQADGTAAEAVVGGIALHAAGVGQPMTVQTGGLITCGATIAVAVFYFLHTTAGGIGVAGDLTTGHFPTVLGYGTTTAIMQLAITVPGLALG